MKNRGFTIVELLVVIVVIGILAAITIVSYTGISQKATASSLQSDLSNGSKKLKMYQVEYGSYPQSMTSIDGNVTYCPTPVDLKYCIKPSSGNAFVYSTFGVINNPQSFALQSTNGTTKYFIKNDSSPIISSNPSLSCPTGFIPVPGSITYGTVDFCVMKYESKILGNDVGIQAYNASFVPDSRATGTPWVNISQINAIAEAQTYPGCTGCHLITEAEWLTIAQNVLGVASNWDNGAGTHTVGTGYIYSGNNDMVVDVGAGEALNADSNDSNGYYRTANVSPSNQRRTLTLSNGEVIWDLAGNVSEWTSGTITSGKLGVTGSGGAWREWPAVTNFGSVVPNPSPATTGISGSDTWTTSNGIGLVYSDAGDTVLAGFMHGGHWSSSGNGAGVLNMTMSNPPTSVLLGVGFRVAR